MELTPKAQFLRGKTNKLDFKIKFFFYAKDSVKWTKRQFTCQNKIFANHLSKKEDISRIFKKLLSIDNEETYMQLTKGRIY